MAIFFNQATLSYNGGATNSNIVSGEITQALTVTKTPTPSAYRAGDVITYIVTLTNSGTSAVTGISVSDDLGAYTQGALTLVPLDYVENSVRYFVSGVLQPAPTVTAGPPLVISGISIPAGGNATLVYRAEVNSFAPLDAQSQITNTVTVSGGGATDPVTATATIITTDAPELSITKSLTPLTVSENSQLTYTFVIENSGNTEAIATDNLSVSDTFNPALSNITVTLNGVALAEGADYTYNPSTGEFATVAGRITVPAATYTTDPVTGAVSVIPGSAVLTVSGTV